MRMIHEIFEYYCMEPLHYKKPNNPKLTQKNQPYFCNHAVNFWLAAEKQMNFKIRIYAL